MFLAVGLNRVGCVRWADGHSDKAGGALDGQTAGRAHNALPLWDVMPPFLSMLLLHSLFRPTPSI